VPRLLRVASNLDWRSAVKLRAIMFAHWAILSFFAWVALQNALLNGSEWVVLLAKVTYLVAVGGLSALVFLVFLVTSFLRLKSGGSSVEDFVFWVLYFVWLGVLVGFGFGVFV